MFPYLFLFLVAAILLFQGLQLLGAPVTPVGVVPPEVIPAPVAARRWGVALTTAGTLMALLGLASPFLDGWSAALVPARGLGLALMGLFGLWLVFGRKVDYRPATGAPASPAHH